MRRSRVIFTLLIAGTSAPLWASLSIPSGTDITFGVLPPGYPTQVKTFQIVATGTGGSFNITSVQTDGNNNNAPTQFFTIFPTSGSVPNNGSVTITLTLKTGFPNGSVLNGTVNVSNVSGGPLSTYLFVNGSTLNVSPQQIGFSLLPGEVKKSSFVVSISPAAKVLVLSGATWLTVDRPSLDNGGTINVTADATGMAPNTMQFSSIDVRCSDNNTCIDKPVSVSLNVLAPAQLQVNVTNPFPISVAEGQTATAQFTMDNTGGVSGNFTVSTSSNGNWLSTGSAQGTISPGSELNISLIANAQNLTAGSYPGQVSIALGGVTVRTFSVNLTVTSRPKLISDTSTAAFAYQTGGSTTACGTKTASVNSNPSGNALKYNVAVSLDNPAGAKWVTALPPSGTTPGTLTLTCDATGLAAGSYTGKVFLSTNDFGGSSQQISLSLTVTTPGPATDITMASTASYKGDRFASGMIASIFGKTLASTTATNTSTQPPTTLGGDTVMVKDSAGTDRASPLFFVSPGQINIQIPLGSANGSANIRVLNGTQVVATTTITLTSTAPGLFFVGANTAAATAARYINGQAPTAVTVFQCSDALHCPTVPIDLTPGAVYVSLYATGLHYVTASNVVSCTIGGVTVPVLYAGDQGTYPGLDQVNVQLIQALAGLGEVDVVLTVDGVASNAVRINIR
jgi:uncharacterized protein (TIGR03437 family)